MNRTLAVSGVEGKLNGQDVTFESWTETMEMISLDSAFPEPDPTWRYEDKAGHLHLPELREGLSGTRVKGYPTLREVRSRPGWCEMCMDIHDEFLHYVCVACGEKINPRLRTHLTEYIEGPRHTVIRYLGDETAIELTQGGHDREFHAEVRGKRFLLGRAATEIRSGEHWTVRIEFYVKKEL